MAVNVRGIYGVRLILSISLNGGNYEKEDNPNSR
jgi:hypothetical protein